jgi:hypothetical protein
MQRPHVDLEWVCRVRPGIAGCLLGEVLRELQQSVELLEIERNVGERDSDVLSIGDEAEQVVRDEFELREDRLPPRPEAVDITDVLDDLPVSE